MNRFWLKAPGQAMLMIVPVAHIGRTRTFSETEIVYTDNWPVRMERSIESCYRKSAYFEHYFPEVQNVLNQRFSNISEMNLASIALLSRGFGLNQPVERTLDTFEFPETIFPSRPSGPDPLEPPRYQLFGDFVPGLSGLDVLFNYGPEASLWVKSGQDK